MAMGQSPEWTHLVTRLDSGRSLYCVGNASTNEVVFESPKFDLEFMPCHCIVEATFMDLVLCLDVETSSVREDDWIYYVTNPLTKQWFALPPCPVVRNELGFKPTAAFVCRQPYDYTRDYQFRVVLISKTIAHVIRLSVYCSEIDMWKVIYLRFVLLVQMHREHTESVQQVVCNGIIYLYHKSCFAAFNPFDVDETTEKATTIDAKVLPSLQVKGVLLECSGNLYVICNPESEGRAVFCYNVCKTVATSLKVWKFNPNQVPLKWQTTFEGKCSGDVYKEAKRLDFYLPDENKDVKFVGMHPKDDKLIYLYLYFDKLLVSCDLRSRSIKLLNRSNRYIFGRFHRFEPQWWPTSVPRPYFSQLLH